MGQDAFHKCNLTALGSSCDSLDICLWCLYKATWRKPTRNPLLTARKFPGHYHPRVRPQPLKQGSQWIIVPLSFSRGQSPKAQSVPISSGSSPADQQENALFYSGFPVSLFHFPQSSTPDPETSSPKTIPARLCFGSGIWVLNCPRSLNFSAKSSSS